jgi:NADH:ubiquinone oxidoreductase subunit E
MARLDKTFPTNDCSLCILSPKLVEAARHRNIELLTLADVQAVAGEAGNFEVKVLQKARYVDVVKCTGCGVCLEQCPTRNLPRFTLAEEPAELAPEHKAVIDELVEQHGASQRACMRILQEVNARLRYLPKDAIQYLASRIGLPVSALYRIGTFYTAFSLVPRGRHTISVCDGTACHIRGAPRLIDELKRELAIEVGQTSQDRRFSLEIVRCLGCCSLAPVVKVDEKIYGGVKPAEIAKILKDWTECGGRGERNW